MSRHGKISEDKAQIAIVLPKWVKDELTRLAKADRRSLSSYAAWQLEIHAKSKNTDSATLGAPAERPTADSSGQSSSVHGLDLARELRGGGRSGSQGKVLGAKGR